MAFRSHVARPFDFRLWSNRILFGLVAAVGVFAVVEWLNGAPADILWAPAQTFVFWALAREIDPDRTLTAHLAGAGAGIWSLLERPSPSALAVGGLVLAARVMVNSTGRRPLTVDLIALAAYATAVSYRRVGWAAGVAIAIAIYVDGRLAEGANTNFTITAGVAALGASVVASAAGAFSVAAVEVRPILVTVAGVLAILTILRPPPEPMSLVDSRMKWRLDLGRLHGARSLVGIVVFAIAILYGAEADRTIPLLGLQVLVLASAEVERLRRHV